MKTTLNIYDVPEYMNGGTRTRRNNKNVKHLLKTTSDRKLLRDMAGQILKRHGI